MLTNRTAQEGLYWQMWMRQQHGFDETHTKLLSNPAFLPEDDCGTDESRGPSPTSSAAGALSAARSAREATHGQDRRSAPSCERAPGCERRRSTAEGDCELRPSHAALFANGGSLAFDRPRGSGVAEGCAIVGENPDGERRSRALQKTPSLAAFRRLQSKKRESSCASNASTVMEMDDEDDALPSAASGMDVAGMHANGSILGAPRSAAASAALHAVASSGLHAVHGVVIGNGHGGGGGESQAGTAASFGVGFVHGAASRARGVEGTHDQSLSRLEPILSADSGDSPADPELMPLGKTKPNA